MHLGANSIGARAPSASTVDPPVFAEKQMKKITGNEEDDAYMYAMQLGSLTVLPMTLKVALELGLLKLMISDNTADRTQAQRLFSSDELVERLGITSNPNASAMIERILRLLASYSVLTFSNSPDANGQIIPRYGAAPVCKYLTPDEDGVSVEALTLLNQDKILMENWNHFKDAVVNGGAPFDLAHGMNLFDYCGKDQRFNSLFNEGMKGNSSIIMKKVLNAYHGFDGAGIIVDVGGGLGSTLSMITSRHTRIKGINFDLPHVISCASPIPGVEHIGGDMFESVPSGDVIFLKWILHDWSDECCLKILQNCREALPNDDGKVVIVEYLLPKTPEHTPEAQLVFHVDMIMLAHNPGGKERSKEEFEALAMESGFIGFKSICVNANVGVMEFLNK